MSEIGKDFHVFSKTLTNVINDNALAADYIEHLEHQLAQEKQRRIEAEKALEEIDFFLSRGMSMYVSNRRNIARQHLDKYKDDE